VHCSAARSKRRGLRSPTPAPFGSRCPVEEEVLQPARQARRPWLDALHRALDDAVAAAYGWPANLSDDDVLIQLP
jgi:hypothetical protein